MNAGRISIYFTDEQIQRLGESLVKWINSTEAKETFVWVDWYWDKEELALADWKLLIQNPKFRPFYDIARQKMVKNMVLNKNIHNAYGMRYLGHYDPELHAYEEAVKDRAAKRDKEAKVEVTPEAWIRLQSLLGSLSKPPSESKQDEETDNC